MNTSKTIYYAVAKGQNPGIYTDWIVAQENVKGYSGAVYESFSSIEDAENYIKKYNEKHPNIPIVSRLETLTKEQRFVIDELLKNKNIALMGAAGCGKSYLLSVIYNEYPKLKKDYMSKCNPWCVAKTPRIQICALTGCAALLLGKKAKTLHSWAGIGLGKGSVSELFNKIRKNTKAMHNWLCTDLLIIDEVSMMTAELLDKLNALAKRVRANNKAFGGIQLMLVGDFYQLPPVNKGDEPTIFAFEADTWKESINVAIELTQIQRQKDIMFQKVLKEARMGELSKESCDILSSHQGRDWKENKIRPTLLFPKRAEVEMINSNNIRALTGQRYRYKARLVYDGKVPDGFDENDETFIRILQKFDSDSPYYKELELVSGAQVILITNIDTNAGLVNGSRGVVVGFTPTMGLPIVEFINGKKEVIGAHTWEVEGYEFVSRSQIPLRLAWAQTIHTSQGSTLDAALIDIGSGVFEYGQAYVALSRVRNLDSLYVYDFVPTAFKVHPKVKAFYSTLVTEGLKDADATEGLKVADATEGLKDADATEDLKDADATEGLKDADATEDLKVADATEGLKDADATEDLKDADATEGLKDADATEDLKDADATEDLKDADATEGLKDADATEGDLENWLFHTLPDNWKPHLCKVKDKLMELSNTLHTRDFLPSKELIWRSLKLTPIESIKVVILGQDPYPTPGNACGLSFSVLPSVRPIPASLKNIYKELASDVNFTAPPHGDLENWAKQGILLLNTVLTVEPGSPQSHSKLGWEQITDTIIEIIAKNTYNTIFVLWGKSAQSKNKLLKTYLDVNHHSIIESSHPSPLSASKGFLGSKPFSKINTLLIETGKIPIDWQLN